MSAFPQFGLNYPGLAASQLMAVGSALQPGTHTSTCDVAHARPCMVDPHSGQPICSCQYDRLMNTYRSYLGSSAASAMSQFSNNPNNLSIELSPTGNYLSGSSMPPGSNPPGPHDQMAMYASGMQGPYPDFKEISTDAWRAAAMAAHAQTGAACYAYDASMGPAGIYSSNPYCTSNYGMDPTGMNRRKNATRETTSQLKGWLYEHRKNPYPTKAEKIMLAILTKMTLTQVSTWFANARRRLKKENKMTWSPRNRGCEDDDKSDDQMGGQDQDDLGDKDDESLSEISSLTDENKHNGSVSPSLRSDGKDHLDNQRLQSQTPTTPSDNASNKPRIWSLADVAMAASPRDPPKSLQTTTDLNTSQMQMHHHQQPTLPPGHPYARPGGIPPRGNPSWPGFFGPGTPTAAAAAAAANSLHILQASANPQHGVNLFSPNPNSAFSAPNGMPHRVPMSMHPGMPLNPPPVPAMMAPHSGVGFTRERAPPMRTTEPVATVPVHSEIKSEKERNHRDRLPSPSTGNGVPVQLTLTQIKQEISVQTASKPKMTSPAPASHHGTFKPADREKEDKKDRTSPTGTGVRRTASSPLSA